jgi:hypothetical protein
VNWEVILQGFCRRLGFEIHRTLPGAEYVQCTPFTYSTYRPWFEERFQRIYAPIVDRTEVTPDRCYVLDELARHCLHLDGEVAECGVYRGGTAHLFATTIAEHARRPVRLHLFDTFAGMPTAADTDASAHRQGDFGDTSLASVRAFLAAFPDVEFHAGVIPDTFRELGAERFALVHVDVDLYQSVRDCCVFFHPRLVNGGVMVFDDYGFPQYRDAARKAVDEFFADKPERPIVLGTGQCVVLKLPA